MNQLTFTDIFIGENGIVVLVSAMLLALLGNFIKKYKRYQAAPHAKSFDLLFWIKDNWDDMIVGFFVTYILVRLLSWVTPYAISLTGIDLETAQSSVGDTVVIVAILIGYYTDSFLDKLIQKKDQESEELE